MKVIKAMKVCLQEAADGNDLAAFLRAAHCPGLLEALSADGIEHDVESLMLCEATQLDRLGLPLGRYQKLQHSLMLIRQQQMEGQTWPKPAQACS